MVSTRQHPRDFPQPEMSPTKGSPRKSRRSTASPPPGSPTTSSSEPTTLTKRVAPNSVATNASPSGWSHTASNLTILWLTVSVPLVIWDSLYILLRPHTMAGGCLQWPLWKPYEIYASIDYMYGWPGWTKGDGFGAAQGVLNAIEAVLYGLYITIVWNHGVPVRAGRGVQVGKGIRGWFAGGRRIEGSVGNRALLVGFAAAVMTSSKTVLYYLTEYYSNYRNVGHNDWKTLVLFYGIMNGLWLVLPVYMTFVFGEDIIEALDIASESSSAASKKKY